MKKALISLLLIVAAVFSFTVPAFADTYYATQTTEYIYTDDGGYIAIELVTYGKKQCGEDRSLTSYTVNGDKNVSKYNSSNELIWRYTLYGTFSVENGVSAACTNASYDTVVNASSWSFSDCAATASGNTAYGVGTVKNKFLFITLETVEIDISISCDVYGNLS